MTVIPATRAAGREFYLTYLNSPSWRATRNRALRLANYRCQKCGGKRELQVHHLSYERLGREWDQDLEVLCDDCHREHHIEAAQDTTLGRYLKLARVALRERAAGTIADLNADVKALCAQYKIPADPRLIEKALSLLIGDLVRERRQERAEPESPLAPDADPCSCEACVTAGVSTRRQRRDWHTGELLHGDDLRRWWAAHDAYYDLVERVGDRLIKAWPGPVRTPAEHERILSEQLREHHKAAYLEERKRKPIDVRLAEIFNRPGATR